MTVHIALTLLAQLGFYFLVRGRAARWACLAVAYVLTPLVFVPTLPITHFLWVISAPSGLWVYAVGAGVLLALTAHDLRRGPAQLARAPASRHLFILYCLLWLLQAFWLVLALTLSEYEPGKRTPTLSDAPIYLIDLLSVHIALIALLVVAWSLSLRSWLMRLLWTGWLLLYLALTLGGLM